MHKRWGWMLTLLRGKRFKVKILYFKPGGAISEQKHKHRSELWLFIFGNNKGNFWHIKQNEWHVFGATKPTLVLEIQYGNKCSERDIERKKCLKIYGVK